MIFTLVGITLGVLALREVVRRSEGKAGLFVKALAGYPKVSLDHGVDLNHAIGTLPCPANPPPPSGMAYWTGPVSSAQTAWAVENLHAHPIGTIIEDIVDGQPIAARIEWHTLQAATGKEGCFKGLNLLRYLSAVHAGGLPETYATLSPTVFIDAGPEPSCPAPFGNSPGAVGGSYDWWWCAFGKPAGMPYDPGGSRQRARLAPMTHTGAHALRELPSPSQARDQVAGEFLARAMMR